MLNLIKSHPAPNFDKCLFWKSGFAGFSDSAYSPRKHLFSSLLGVGIRESLELS